MCNGRGGNREETSTCMRSERGGERREKGRER